MYQHPDVYAGHICSNAAETIWPIADKPKFLNYTDDDGFAVPIYCRLTIGLTSAAKKQSAIRRVLTANRRPRQCGARGILARSGSGESHQFGHDRHRA